MTNKEIKKQVVFSGIQPSGLLHIGNYLGAIQSWIKLSNEKPQNMKIYFSIVDYHALTKISDPNNPISFKNDLWNLIFDILSLGLNIENCHLFIQSSVYQHLELFWILSSFTSIGELLRMNQYKEKSSHHENFISATLLNYPILQAADILLYKAEIIPVGEDQKQHLELSRRIAQRFNHRFKRKFFPKPRALLTHCPKIMGMDGINKMSKTYNNYISFSETYSSLSQKIIKAFTDPNRKRKTDPGNPDICNIFTIHKEFTKKEDLQTISQDCQKAKIGCVDCKKILIHNLWSFIEPIQERKADIIQKKELYKNIILDSNNKMKSIANKTMTKVRKLLNMDYF